MYRPSCRRRRRRGVAPQPPHAEPEQVDAEVPAQPAQPAETPTGAARSDRWGAPPCRRSCCAVQCDNKEGVRQACLLAPQGRPRGRGEYGGLAVGCGGDSKDAADASGGAPAWAAQQHPRCRFKRSAAPIVRFCRPGAISCPTNEGARGGVSFC